MDRITVQIDKFSEADFLDGTTPPGFEPWEAWVFQGDSGRCLEAVTADTLHALVLRIKRVIVEFVPEAETETRRLSAPALKALAAIQEPHRLQDVAAATGLSPTSAWNVLRTLREKGYATTTTMGRSTRSLYVTTEAGTEALGKEAVPA